MSAPAAETQEHQITYLSHRLDAVSAVLAAGHDAVCIFVNDVADAAAIEELHKVGIKAIALRVRFASFRPVVSEH